MRELRTCPVCNESIPWGRRSPSAYRKVTTCGKPECVQRQRVASSRATRGDPVIADAVAAKWCARCGKRMWARAKEGARAFAKRRYCCAACGNEAKCGVRIRPPAAPPPPPVMPRPPSDAESKWAALLRRDAFADNVRTSALGSVGAAPSLLGLASSSAGWATRSGDA